MENSIKLIEISAEKAVNHTNNEYNPYEWKKRITQLQNWFPDVKFYEYGKNVYYIYLSDGVRFIKELEYSSSLDAAGYKSYFLNSNVLEQYPLKLSKTKEDIKFAKELCGLANIVFASVYFNI